MSDVDVSYYTHWHLLLWIVAYDVVLKYCTVHPHPHTHIHTHIHIHELQQPTLSELTQNKNREFRTTMNE